MINTHSMKYGRSQAGSTLIAVLLLLVVITIVGVIAMKQGLTSLNIATNSQIQTVLAQSSDAVINQIAQADVSQITSIIGVLGAAVIKSDSEPGQEYVFCYRPTSADPFGLSINANIIQGRTNGTVAPIDVSAGNFCDLTTDFGSGRRATVTQVAVTVPLDVSPLPPLTALSHGGTDVSYGSQLPPNFVIKKRIRVSSTSMLPAFSTSPLATVQTECLQGRISDNADAPLTNVENLTDCLARQGVPASTQVQEFSMDTAPIETGP